MPQDPPPRRSFDYVPIIVWAGVICFGLLVWWAFPKVYAWMDWQSCIASLHTNCG